MAAVIGQPEFLLVCHLKDDGHDVWFLSGLVLVLKRKTPPEMGGVLVVDVIGLLGPLAWIRRGWHFPDDGPFGTPLKTRQALPHERGSQPGGGAAGCRRHR